MRFLFVVSHVRTQASFRPLLTEMPLPLARTFDSVHFHEHLWVLVQGTFTPLVHAHAGRTTTGFQWTALRAAAEPPRWADKKPR